MYIYIDFVYLFRNVLYKYLTKRHSQNISYISTLLRTNLNKKCKNVYVIKIVIR